MIVGDSIEPMVRRSVMASTTRQWGTAAALALFALTLAPNAAAPATAQQPRAHEPAPMAGRTLVVGTKPAPPFAIHNADGSWSGIAIELWNGIAKDIGVSFTYQQRDLQGLINGVRDGTLDAAVAALTVTPAREAIIDFSHPFYSTGLGIATGREPGGLLNTLSVLLSPAFLTAVGTLAALLLGVGVVIWALERHANPQQFGGGVLRGIGSGFWWSAVTMTTVGYGDKAPTTLVGRVIGVIWMFAAVIIISGFTAAIASSLTIGQLKPRISGPQDLANARTMAVAGSSAVAWLNGQHIRFTTVATPQAGLSAVADGRADAFVYDAPILRYYLAEDSALRDKVTVLPNTVERQDYAIALPQGSPLRERINRALLKRVLAPSWKQELDKYMSR